MRALAAPRCAITTNAISDGTAKGSTVKAQSAIHPVIGGLGRPVGGLKDAATPRITAMVSATNNSPTPHTAGPTTDRRGGAGAVAAASAVVLVLTVCPEPMTGNTPPDGPMPTPA